MGIARDITSLRRALDEVHARLDEKNVLLREIQHRVQNNLQVIISLLNLQLHDATSEETRKSLRLAISRIHTFSDLYSQLQENENTAYIRMDQFFYTIVPRVLNSKDFAERPKLKLEIEEVLLPLDKAISAGSFLTR